MLVSDLMKTDVRTLGLDTSILSTADKMTDADVDTMFVTREGEVIGIMTGKELAECISQGHRPQDCLVFRHMRLEVRTSGPSMSLADATEIMLAARLTRLPVIALRRLVGEVCLADVVRAKTEEPSSRTVAMS